METSRRILHFITRANWAFFFGASIFGLLITPPDFAGGIIAGGIIVTVNFHLLARTLKKALTPPHLASHTVVLAKYYARFVVSGLIIFALISWQLVHPLGLVIGLSVVVASIMLATLWEVKKIILKEAF